MRIINHFGGTELYCLNRIFLYCDKERYDLNKYVQVLGETPDGAVLVAEQPCDYTGFFYYEDSIGTPSVGATRLCVEALW